jgi:pentatricopeptide repeat protein
MEIKEYIIILISGIALILSFISLIITLIQKNKETKRTIRKTLTDTLESISKIGIEVTKLKGSKDIDFNSEQGIQLRRNYNSQRRILIAHADFLALRYDNLATEIDCNILAGAYAAIGDLDKAEYFWKKTIDKSISPPIKLMNLRGFGTFLFNNGKENLARKIFKEAIAQNLQENDENKVLKTDTYLMLSDLEKDCNNKVNYESSLTAAMEICSTIVNKRKKREMEERIRLKLPLPM